MVRVGNGESISFWLDVWTGDEALAETYPALYSHYRSQDITVREVVTNGIQTALVPQLTAMTVDQMSSIQEMIAGSLTSVLAKVLTPEESIGC